MQYPYAERRYTMRDGSQQPSVRVRVDPDRRVQAVVEQIREAEMAQAIDRLRLIHSEREKRVYILCNIPLGIPVDELVTWRELAGDGRLARALEICEDKGGEALPLAGKELTRLFPDLWRTRKAGEDWARKDPLRPYNSILEFGASLRLIVRPVRRAGKALVRHGADTREALARCWG